MAVTTGLAETTAAAETTPVELVIGGMTCAACAARVQAKLNKVAGVTASVNLSTERAYVSAPPTVSVDTLIGVVEATGYTAEVAPPPEPQAAGPSRTETAEDAAVRRLRRRLTLALVFFVPLTDLSMMLSIFPWTRFAGWQWLLVALAAPVAIWAAWPFHAAALRQARHLSSSMDTLVSLGILAACGWSVYAMFALDHGQTGPNGQQSGLDSLLHGGSGGGIYLEVAASVTTFLLAGRLYEARARRTAALAMRELAAAGARDACVLNDDGTERRIPAGQLEQGQRFVVRPGERIAADGEVLTGQSAVDRSMMTGESVPVDAAAGDAVTGGTIVLTGRLVVRAERVGAGTQLAHMLRLVEQAQAGKAGIQRLADRVCAVFVPSVLACSVLTLAGWLAAGSPAGHAVSAALAVLIIACPCALGLATPAALIVASGRGARMGIFIKGYQALESSRAIDTVVLDKTGTVTTGQMTVTATELRPGTSRDDLLRYAGSVEQASEHAVANAITNLARSEAPSLAGKLTDADGFEALPGLGARGVVAGHEVVIGRTRLFADRGVTIPADLAAWCRAREHDGCTTVLAAWDDELRGAFAVTDTVKPSAAAAVARLRALGLRPALLTGDNAATARAVGAATGIDEIRSEALPADKAQVIRELESQGRSVAMVGDGVNDGPALAAARLGLALGSGTDVAIVAADMILLRDDLGAVPDAIALARAAFRTIRANLAWAFCYNVLAIPLAALGLANPLVAAATMTLSSVFVVWNSLRLRRFNPKGRPAHRLTWSVPAADLRIDPLTGTNVVVTPWRQTRPNLPEGPCPFCPGGLEAPGPYDVRHFGNRWAALPGGRHEVVLHSPDHDASFPALGDEQAARVVELWSARTAALGAREDVAYVFVFENRGRAIGATIDHPHSQVMAFGAIPPIPAHELSGGKCHFCTEPDDDLLVVRRAGWQAAVPWAPSWPYELLIFPDQHVPDLPAAGPGLRAGLGAMLVDVLARVERFLGPGAPYMLWFHQRPADGDGWPAAHLHAHLAPALRAPGVRRHLAAAEFGAGVFFDPVDPRQAAARLRSASA